MSVQAGNRPVQSLLSYPGTAVSAVHRLGKCLSLGFHLQVNIYQRLQAKTGCNKENVWKARRWSEPEPGTSC